MPEEVETQTEEAKEPDITVSVAEDDYKPKLSDEDVAKLSDESASDDEVSRYAKDAQKRIKSLYIANQEWRRRVVQSQKDMATATNLADQLYRENQNLKQNVQRSETALIEQAIQRNEAELQSAKNRLFFAVQSQKPEEIVAANEEMARCVAEKNHLKLIKPSAPGEGTNEGEPPPQAQPQQQPPSAETEAWISRNPWFKSNPEMHAYALTVHHALANQGIGEQNGTAYFGAIDQEMRKRYPEQFGMKAPEPKEPQQTQPKESGGRPVTVTGATRTNGAPAQRSPRHVVLTESQVRIANTLGITPEDYARELIKQQAAEKGTVQ